MTSSLNMARMMYVVFKEAPIIVPADVFIGICAKSIGLIPIHSSRFSGKRHIRYNRCCYKFIFTSSETTDAEMSLVWKEINDRKECTLFETYSGLISCKLLTYLDSFERFHFGTIKNNAMYFGDQDFFVFLTGMFFLKLLPSLLWKASLLSCVLCNFNCTQRVAVFLVP